MAKSVSRQVKFSDVMWDELNVQAAVERKAGRGDVIRKACRRYLDDTRDQRPQCVPDEVD